MNVATELMSRWFALRQSVSIVASDIFFFALGLLLAWKLGTKKTPIYLMISALVVYAVCSIMVITNHEYIGAIFAEYIGAMAAFMFVGNIAGYIIRLNKNKKSTS